MKITLSKVAEIVAGEIKGDPAKIVQGAAPLGQATKNDITFAGEAKYLKQVSSSKAGAVIVPMDFECNGIDLICTENPQVAFAKILTLFSPPSKKDYGPNPPHYIGKNFKHGKDLLMAPFVAIQDNVSLGNRVSLHPKL